MSIVIVGAGASGLMLGALLAEYGVNVLLLEAQEAVGKKLSICGGGRGNVSHEAIDPRKDYFGENRAFSMSAIKRLPTHVLLARLTEWGFDTELCERGCWFGKGRVQQLVTLLSERILRAGSEIRLGARVVDLKATEQGYGVRLADGSEIEAQRVVLACGSKACPKIGGCEDGLRLAEGLGLRLTETQPALLPILFDEQTRQRLGDLAGIALDPVALSVGTETVHGSLVFRPDGLGGLGVFQASLVLAHLSNGSAITIDFSPTCNLAEVLACARKESGKKQVSVVLGQVLPKRLASALVMDLPCATKQVGQLSKAEEQLCLQRCHAFTFTPMSNCSYHVAEVMIGGVATDQLSSKTMEVKTHPGLYILGELLDVTGRLGGYNLHWAFASASACAEALLAAKEV